MEILMGLRSCAHAPGTRTLNNECVYSHLCVCVCTDVGMPISYLFEAHEEHEDLDDQDGDGLGREPPRQPLRQQQRQEDA
eukprot:11990-Eustigmatos_ZCMA.PRE.1